MKLSEVLQRTKEWGGWLYIIVVFLLVVPTMVVVAIYLPLFEKGEGTGEPAIEEPSPYEMALITLDEEDVAVIETGSVGRGYLSRMPLSLDMLIEMAEEFNHGIVFHTYGRLHAPGDYFWVEKHHFYLIHETITYYHTLEG